MLVIQNVEENSDDKMTKNKSKFRTKNLGATKLIGGRNQRKRERGSDTWAQKCAPKYK
jgi:hypothetical protein